MSNQPKIALNKIVSDPTLKDLFDVLKKDIMMSMNCHAIAQVQSFDAEAQTVSATLVYSKTYFEKSPNGIYNPVQVPYPILVDCPVISLGGGAASLTFPIQKGDQCVILFNDRDIDNWVAGAASGPVASPRMHSFSDGIALVGLNPISDYDTDRAVLQNDEAFVAVGAALIEIANNTTSLGAILGDVMGCISALVPALAAIDPVGAAALLVQIGVVNGLIGGLLE